MKRIVFMAAGIVLAVISLALAQTLRGSLTKPAIAHHTVQAGAVASPSETQASRPAVVAPSRASDATPAGDAPPARAMALRLDEPALSPAPAPVSSDPAPAAVPPATEKKDENPAIAAVSPAPPAPPVITLVAKIDLATQRMTIIEHGKPKLTWIVSSGARGYDTPRGLFQPSWMAKEWFSRQYDNAPMPHAVFFKDGAAVHATMNPSSLGTPASHGCVRLSKTNAASFYALVQRHGMKHTRIHVYGVPRHAPEAIAARSSTTRHTTGRVRDSQQTPMTSAHFYSSNPGSAIARQVPAKAYRPVPVRVVQYNAAPRRY